MEDNKLIAEFMGYDDTGHLCQWEYHTSWDWLMPVVEKIYSIDADVDFFKNISLEATYKAVVEFIKHINQ